MIELVLLETRQRIAAIDLLLRREQTLIEVMNATFDGVGIHQNGIILFANKALADLWGLTVDELTGRNGYDFWREEDHPKLREIARNREQVSRVEVEALSASGEQIPCEVQGRPILFNGSKARLFTVRDLRSDRAGERQRHELEWLHLALGAADAGTWEWCDESGRQLWSTEARRLLGVDRLAGPADWTDSIDMRDLPQVLNQIDGAMWLGKPFHIEFRCHVGGKLRWVDMRGKRIERSGHSPCYLGVVSDVTARHLLEERLRNQQSLHRAIVENAVDAIEVVDPDSFRIVEFNDAACQLLGYQRNEYAQLTIADTQAEFSLKELRSRAASILVGERLVFDTRHRHKEGHLLDVHVRLRKVEIDGQQYLVVIWGDVTERKRSEEQMRILSQALEQNPHGIMVTDQTTRVTYVNQAFTTTTGFSADEIVGKSANWLGEEHTPQETLDDLARVVAQGREWRGEFHNQRKDGRIGIDLTHISPVRDEDGKISHFIGIQEDVTRQREIEAKLARYQQNLEQEVSRRTEALANAEARLGMVIESTPDGIIELDTDGRIVMANQAAVRLLARPMNELEGALMHGVVHHHHANGYRHQEEACPILSCLSASREVRVLEDVFWRPDGTSLPVSYAAHPMVEQGQTIGVVIVFSDNTLRQMAADAMRSAQESAERLALAKSEFLAHMSHEIRTPLNGVIGLAQIGYRESDGNRRLHGLFDKIIHSGRMLSIILNDILDFSRIEANKLQLEEAPFEPVMIARDAVDLVRPRLNSGVSLRAEVGDGIPAAVLGDQTRVSQIVLNLLSNAVKFTKSGEVVVALGCSDGRLTYRVSDSGIGIEPEAIERLFAPFEQGDSSTSRQYGGTGLGLAISQRLATMMGATLSVESRVGVGSHFTLHLPCRETAMPAPASAGHPSEESRHRLAGLRLLVAEDNEISRLVLEDMLTGEGAECLLVTNGAEAVATVENEPDRFDLLMIDVQMPVMDGRADCRLSARRRMRWPKSMLSVWMREWLPC